MNNDITNYMCNYYTYIYVFVYKLKPANLKNKNNYMVFCIRNIKKNTHFTLYIGK